MRLDAVSEGESRMHCGCFDARMQCEVRFGGRDVSAWRCSTSDGSVTPANQMLATFILHLSTNERPR